MALRPGLSDMGAVDWVKRTRHLKMNVGKTVKAPDGTDSRILIRDTWNSDIVDALKPEAADIVVYRHRFSGFYETDLHKILQRLGIRALIFAGCNQHMRGPHGTRCDVQGLSAGASCGLHERAIGQAFARSNQEATLLTTEVLLGWVATLDGFNRRTRAVDRRGENVVTRRAPRS